VSPATEFRALRSAFAYFSIIPVGRTDDPDGRAVAWLPLVGAALGALAGTAALGASRIGPHAIAVAIAFGATIVLTGAIHLDGFLDGCDAVFASVSPQRRLEILKDPRHGTFALAGLAVLMPLWLAALWTLAPPTYPLALAFAAACSRWSAVVHAVRAPVLRPGATTSALAKPPPLATLALCAILVVALAVPFAWRGAAAVAAAAIVAAAALSWSRVRFGGHLAGDAYGFAIVLAEVAVLLVLGAG
jgi:adenosylcobinamide-GDP ribazoletransferase